jgi:hypothetical protein
MGVASSLLASLLLVALGSSFSPLRNWVLYRKQQYVFANPTSTQNVTWQIQWEEQALTMTVGAVQPTYLRDVTLELKGISAPHVLPTMPVRATFETPPNWPIHIKLTSIVERSSSQSPAEYTLIFDVRRKRKAWST